MPSTGVFNGHRGLEAIKSRYSHKSEIAKTGYHKIKLSDYDIAAELTSTTRVGFHKYTFPKTEDAYVSFYTGEFLAQGKIDLSYIRNVSDTEIEGYSIIGSTLRRPKPTYVYFVAKLNQPFTELN